MQENSYISNFKTNLLKLFVIVLFLILAILFAIWLGNIYSEASSQNKINDWSKARFDEFYAARPNSIDLVFLGSSHSYCTFDPENFDQKLGISSYQLGMPQQTPDSSYYTLLEVLNYQKPKVVVMELYWDVLDNEFDVAQVETFFKVLNNETLKQDYIENVMPINERVKFNIDAVRLQADYFAFKNNEIKEYTEENPKFQNPSVPLDNTMQLGSEYYRSKGYIFCDYIMTQEEYDKINNKPVAKVDFQMAETQKYYLEQIVKTCQENDIELIFVTAPISNVSLNKIENYAEIHMEMAAFAESQGVKYLDFNILNQNGELFKDQHFRDASHLNYDGAKIADEYFIDWFYNK